MDNGLDGLGSIPGRAEFRLAMGPTQPPMREILGAVSSWVKRLGHEAAHSSPSSDSVKNGGAIPALFVTYLTN
jgi:hypothetical protein